MANTPPTTSLQSLLAQARQFVRENPSGAAAVVRSWVATAPAKTPQSQ